ncbi:MAG: DUF6802 family protein [Sciscionella sp.]
MYIDDGGAAETDISVEVDGQEYTANETVDYDHDGVLDGAQTATPDGGELLYVDSDHDGVADMAIGYDHSGQVISEARLDPHTGSWIGETPTSDPGSDPAADQASGTSEEIHVDTDHGEVDAGAATVDSDGDGQNDTAIVHDGGDTVLFTDNDHDGKADVATVIGSDGHTETVEHTGPGEWSTAGGGAAKDPAGDQLWGQVVGSAFGEGVVRIDPSTGQWISQN